jgi:hypothetical protein
MMDRLDAIYWQQAPRRQIAAAPQCLLSRPGKERRATTKRPVRIHFEAGSASLCWSLPARG